MSTIDTGSPADHKLVYYWDEINEGNSDLFGQKCARLAVAKHAGIPVPPFFAITLHGVRQILENRGLPDALLREVECNVGRLEDETGCSISSTSRPLVIAIRSGDPFSMAGAMFSYLNVGINEKTIPALVETFQNESAILQMYLDSLIDHAFMVEGHPREELDDVLSRVGEHQGDISVLRELIDLAGAKAPTFPVDARAHMSDAINAVAVSWQNFATAAFREEMEIEKDVFPSIFVQQMAFGNLSESAFLAFCTHNPIDGTAASHGDFALGTDGRLMMRGIGPKRTPIHKLTSHFPDAARDLEDHICTILRIFQRPQDIEAIIEKNKLKLLQIVDAHLAPAARRTIVEDLQQGGVLGSGEEIPPIPGIRRTRVIKTFRLRPGVELNTLAKGQPTHPGTVEGRLALCADDAIRLGVRRGMKTILVLSEPDERVLPLLLKRQIEGFAATYASTHDYAAAMLSHVPSVMSIDAETDDNNYLVGLDHTRIPVGARIILDGTAGRLYQVPTISGTALTEDKPILVTPHDLSGYELERETRADYGHMDYEELLRAHAEFVEKIGLFKGDDRVSWMPTDRTIEYALLELVTHFIHIMIFEKAKELGISHFNAQLDVAVADGSLDRVPGMEHKNIALEKDGEKLVVVLSTEVSYDHETISSAAFTRAELNEIERGIADEGLPAKLYVKQSKLSRHTQFVSTTCLGFPSQHLEAIVKVLKRIEKLS